MKIKKIFIVIFVICIISCFSDKKDSKNEGNDNVPVTNVELNKPSTSIVVGATEQLSAQITPDNATDQSVIWSTTDEDIVEVSESGLIKGISIGNAIIKAITVDGYKESSCNVTVAASPILIQDIEILDTLSVDIGYTRQISIVITPSNATNQKIAWSTSDSLIADVSSTGIVTAKSAGIVTITAKSEDGGHTDTCTVTSNYVDVSDVLLNKNSTSIEIGNTEVLTETVSPSNATNKQVVWSSSNETVATVDTDGKVYANSVGNADITVTTVDGTKTDVCNVTVTPVIVNVVNIGLNKYYINIKQGENFQLREEINPTNATDQNVLWESEDMGIVHVNTSGLITGVSVGKAEITVKSVDGNKTSKCVVNVVGDCYNNGTIELVKDISSMSADSSLKYKTVVGSNVFFRADDGINGVELWKSDGTEVGTFMVKNINADGGSNIKELCSLGSILLFSADDGVNGNELWRSDGTEAGTYMLKNIQTDSGNSYPRNFKVMNGNAYFYAYGPAYESGLYKTDGTESGTVFIKFISIYNNNNEDSIVILNDTLYFGADDGVNGTELWKSDGTEAGTVMVKNIRSDSESSFPEKLIAYNNEVYFTVYCEGDSIELWKSDGTEAGTIMIKEFNGVLSAYLDDLTVFDGMLYFVADNGAGKQLWKTDGTEAGTTVVKELSVTMSSYPESLVSFNSKLYFVFKYAIWESDGTEANTVEVYSFGGSDSPKNLCIVGSKIYFSAYSYQGTELWMTDGTHSGTEIVKNINPYDDNAATGDSSNPNDLISNGTMLYFSASDLLHGEELWISDGTESGTVLVKDINKTDSSSPRDLICAGDKMYFSAENPIFGRELWRTDGTEAGTLRITDILSGDMSGYPQNFLVAGNMLFFSGKSSLTNMAFFKSDGTESGLVELEDVGSGEGVASKPISIGNDVYYSTYGKFSNNSYIYKYDSQTQNMDVFKTFYSRGCGMMAKINSKLFISGYDSTNGGALWIVDEASGNAELVKSINSDDDGGLGDFTVVGNILYFSADDDVHGDELWRSDGTKAGTYLVKDIYTDDDSYPRILGSINSIVYFSADSESGYDNLWRSDGTESGTYILKDIRVRSYSSTINDIMYFIADDGTNGYELWRTDGTEAGTVMIKNINVSGDSDPSCLTFAGSTLYFFADDGIHGEELWKSDGTEAGTVLVNDLYPGEEGIIDTTNPYIVFHNNYLYFNGKTPEYGSELFKMAVY